MKPALTSRRWLAASASAGSSRRVGTYVWDQRMRDRRLGRGGGAPFVLPYPSGAVRAASRTGGPMSPRLTLVRRLLVLLVLAAVAALPTTAGAATFPDIIRLPDGWHPEGIASGRGTSLYVGSIPTGAVWKGDARTGQGDVLVPGQTGRSAIGIKVDRRNRLFVAGGATGKAFVHSGRGGG